MADQENGEKMGGVVPNDRTWKYLGIMYCETDGTSKMWQQRLYQTKF